MSQVSQNGCGDEKSEAAGGPVTAEQTRHCQGGLPSDVAKEPRWLQVQASDSVSHLSGRFWECLYRVTHQVRP